MPALRFQAALTMSWSFPRAREENDHHRLTRPSPRCCQPAGGDADAIARPPPPTEFAKQKSAAAQSKARAESGAALGSHARTDKDSPRQRDRRCRAPVRTTL